MIKAGSLFYAIVVSLIIAIVSSSLILYAYLTHIEFDDLKINQSLHRNVNSGLQLLLGSQSLIELNTAKTLDLFGRQTDSVMLHRKSWGAYEIIISQAFFRDKIIQKIAQVGYFSDTINRYSIYLADEDKPLAICGKTILKGTAYLPKSGLKIAYIEGENFIGTQLVQGTIKTSKQQLPEFNKMLNEDIQLMLLGRSIRLDDSVVICTQGFPQDSLKNSFEKPTLLLTGNGSFTLANCFYSGNMLITASHQIKISASALLKDIIVCAPKVIVEEGFKGNVQIFASDTILIGKKASFTYPSVLGIVLNKRSGKFPAIILNEKDTVCGNIFVYKKEEQEKKPGIVINKNAFVQGQVYSNGYIDLKGIIHGSLMCTSILLSTPSSVYENHLLNVIIDRTQLSPYFVGINLVREYKEKKIVKWLD